MTQRQRNRRLREKEVHLWQPAQGSGEVSVGLAYPNRYWVAMSNLGFQTVYRLLAEERRFSVERVYMPEEPEVQGESWETFESGKVLSQLDILAVSITTTTTTTGRGLQQQQQQTNKQLVEAYLLIQTAKRSCKLPH